MMSGHNSTVIVPNYKTAVFSMVIFRTPYRLNTKQTKCKTNTRGLREELCPGIDARGGATKQFLAETQNLHEIIKIPTEIHSKVPQLCVGVVLCTLEFALVLYLVFCN